MIRTDNALNLESLIAENETILLDTSVLIGNIGSSYNTNEKTSFSEELIRHLDIGANLYITNLICRELDDGGKIKKKDIKKIHKNRHYLATLRDGRERDKLDRKLINSFREKDKIIDFHYDNEYSEIYADCASFSGSLSETDIELLISSIILSRKSKKCALISDDIGIFKTLTEYERQTGYIHNLKFFVKKEAGYIELRRPKSVSL